MIRSEAAAIQKVTKRELQRLALRTGKLTAWALLRSPLPRIVEGACFQLLALLCRLADPGFYYQANRVELQMWLRADRTHVMVASDLAPSLEQFWLAVDEIDKEEHSPYRPAIEAWLIKNVPSDSHTAIRVTDKLLREDLRSSHKLGIYLHFITKVRVQLTRESVDKLLKRILLVALEKRDPYAPSAPIGPARRAAASLVFAWPQLDSQLFDLLKEGHGDQSVLISILAVVGRERQEARAGTFLGTAGAVPSAGSVSQLAAKFSWTTRPTTRRIASPSRATGGWIRYLVQQLWPGVLAVLVCAGTAVLAVSQDLPSPPVAVGLVQAVPLLALLVTTNVFTVTLSNYRLPGRIARFTSQGSHLTVAYASIVALLIASLAQTPDRTLLQRTLAWVSIALLATFAVSVLTLVPRLLLNTDEASTAKRYYRARVRKVRTAGKAFGEWQVRAVQARVNLLQSPNVRMDVSATATPHGTALYATNRGLFCPDPARVARAFDLSDRGSATLIVTRAIGSLVEAGEPIAILQPSSGVTLEPGSPRKIQKCLQPIARPDLETAIRDCTSLTNLTFTLLKEGDSAAADTSAPYAIDLIRHFQEAARERRTALLERLHSRTTNLAAASGDQRVVIEPSETRRLPVATPVHIISTLLVRQASKDDDQGANTALRMLNALIASSDITDAATITAAGKLSEDFGESETRPLGTIAQLTASLGMRALEIDDNIALGMITSTLQKNFRQDSCQIALAGLAARSTSYDHATWREVLSTYFNALADDSTSTGVRLRGLCLIGAVALNCGNLGAALEVADHLRRFNLQDRIRTSTRRVLVERLAVEVQLLGVSTISSAEDATANFLEFACSLWGLRGDTSTDVDSAPPSVGRP